MWLWMIPYSRRISILLLTGINSVIQIVRNWHISDRWQLHNKYCSCTCSLSRHELHVLSCTIDHVINFKALMFKKLCTIHMFIVHSKFGTKLLNNRRKINQLMHNINNEINKMVVSVLCKLWLILYVITLQSAVSFYSAGEFKWVNIKLASVSCGKLSNVNRGMIWIRV